MKRLCHVVLFSVSYVPFECNPSRMFLVYNIDSKNTGTL